MTDAFAFFGFPRRPVLSDEALKETYFRLAASLHPDASSGDAARFAELQECRQILADPARRLRHLHELAFPEVPAPAPSGAVGELFFQVSSTLQRVKALVEKRSATQSALARALLAGEVAETLRALHFLQEAIAAQETRAREKLAALDARWPEVEAGDLAALAREFTFLGKWKGELAEWEFRLAQE